MRKDVAVRTAEPTHGSSTERSGNLILLTLLEPCVKGCEEHPRLAVLGVSKELEH